MTAVNLAKKLESDLNRMSIDYPHDLLLAWTGWELGQLERWITETNASKESGVPDWPEFLHTIRKETAIECEVEPLTTDPDRVSADLWAAHPRVKVRVPPLWRHYKGGLYRLLSLAVESTNTFEGAAVVIYLSLSTGIVHTRNAGEFFGRTGMNADGEQRFSPVLREK